MADLVFTRRLTPGAAARRHADEMAAVLADPDLYIWPRPG